VGFINDFVDAKLLEGQLLCFDHGLNDLYGVSIESWVVDEVVFRDLAEEVKLFQQWHKDWVPINNG
jgi:hypothetical protein